MHDIDEIMEVELKNSKNDGMDDTEMTLFGCQRQQTLCRDGKDKGPTSLTRSSLL
jgi:hypothetical protein